MKIRSMLTIIAIVAVVAASANAVPLFSEYFESPDITTYSKGTLPDNGNWVGAAQGYNSNQHGMTDKAGGDFSAPEGNDQAYAFRYTNSGITTAQGVIGALEANLKYTVWFDVVRDDGKLPGLPYIVELVAFGPDQDNVARKECRGTRPGTILASAIGSATDDGQWTTVTFEYTAEADSPDIGKDVGIRFLGATNSAIIDNVQLQLVPEPATISLLALGGFGALVRRRRSN